VVLLLLFCLLPVRNVVLDVPTIDALPESAPARQVYEKYEENFAPAMKDHANFSLLLSSEKEMLNESDLVALEKFTKTLKENKDVHEVTDIFSVTGMDAKTLWGTLQSPAGPALQPVVDSFISGEYASLQVYLKNEPKDNEAKVWLRTQSGKWEKNGDFDIIPGGQLRFEQELFDEITDNIFYGFSIIILSTFFILMIAFRSLLIPIKAIIMNILSLTATFGIVTWIFQGGHFGIPETNIMLILPVFIFGLVFGLSMDYEVFLISRMYEVYGETKDNEYATKEGLVSTSRIITSAAAIMIVVTGAFAFTDLMPVKQMGIGIAIAIFLDATIVRLILVPSLMKLLGDWNWWLPFRKKTKQNEEV
ncbi:MAG: MMPL family transporter, partial [Bacilli bacterium]